MIHNIITYVVIVAGGQGARMGTAIPKQFLEIQGKPVLYHTIRAFTGSLPDAKIILVLPAQQISYAQMVLQHFPERLDVTIVAGGATRFHSVQNGLKVITAPGIIMVHDGVRPLINHELILRCLQQAAEKGSAVPAIPVADSVRRTFPDDTSSPIDRAALRLVQTPQTFRTEILLPAFEQAYQDSFTDEATVCEAAGHRIFLTTGDKYNIKITTPEDLAIAEAIMSTRNNYA